MSECTASGRNDVSDLHVTEGGDSDVWVRPSVLARLVMVVLYVISVLLGALTAGSVRGGGDWWLLVLGLPSAVAAIQGLGSGVIVRRGIWTLRGVFRERDVPAGFIEGITFESGLSVVVPGGLTFSTSLVQGPKRPRQMRRTRTAAVLARSSGIDVRVFDRRALDGAKRSLTEDEREVLRGCLRTRRYRLAWWQWALYVVWLAVVVGVLIS